MKLKNTKLGNRWWHVVNTKIIKSVNWFHRYKSEEQIGLYMGMVIPFY